MTRLEYESLIFPTNLFHSVEEFEEFVKIKEEGWEQGLLNLMEICEKNELYEYCAIIKKELERESDQ